jgi:hypothetical protein
MAAGPELSTSPDFAAHVAFYPASYIACRETAAEMMGAPTGWFGRKKD